MRYFNVRAKRWFLGLINNFTVSSLWEIGFVRFELKPLASQLYAFLWAFCLLVQNRRRVLTANFSPGSNLNLNVKAFCVSPPPLSLTEQQEKEIDGMGIKLKIPPPSISRCGVGKLFSLLLAGKQKLRLNFRLEFVRIF